MRFRQAHDAQNFGMAGDAFIEALTADAGIAFRYFVTRSSGALGATLARTGRVPSTVSLLDKQIEQFPDLHLLCDYDPPVIKRLVQLRESNIDKGLQSVAVITQGKAASVSVSQIFNSGYNLPSFAYSLVDEVVIESWARDFARGGACYCTHLLPRPENIDRLKRCGITKIIVHIRDPRQSLVSMVHHVNKYPDQIPHLLKSGYRNRTITEQTDDVLSFYISRIKFIEGWMRAEGELDILFSTFEDFVRDRQGFIQRYLDYYGGSLQHFSYEEATAQHVGTDYHFRAGEIDEWRRVLPAREAARLSLWLPDEMKQRFGWPS
jgi:hypothetical protein